MENVKEENVKVKVPSDNEQMSVTFSDGFVVSLDPGAVVEVPADKAKSMTSLNIEAE